MPKFWVTLQALSTCATCIRILLTACFRLMMVYTTDPTSHSPFQGAPSAAGPWCKWIAILRGELFMCVWY